MFNIDEELAQVKKYMLASTVELLPDNSLTTFLTCSGKMIRSSLAILYLKALGLTLSPNIYKILAAGEIMHNASLLHDDVIDGADYRRNQLTISKKYSSKISILVGDYLMSVVFENLFDLNRDILNTFKTTSQQMAIAEIEQFFLRGKLPTVEQYLDICKGKTASLFVAIMKSCALELDFDLKLAENFAIAFGISFQIKNDLDNVSANTDAKNRIYTAKDILGIENTNLLLDNYKEEMKNILTKLPQNIYRKFLEVLI